MDRATVRTVVGIWLIWAVALLVFQVVVQTRYAPERPDTIRVHDLALPSSAWP